MMRDTAQPIDARNAVVRHSKRPLDSAGAAARGPGANTRFAFGAPEVVEARSGVGWRVAA